jgi:3-oxoacyl-[acyl-carrier protein] reductase
VSDRYATFTRSAVGKKVAETAGLPQPLVLNRWSEKAPAIAGPILVTTGITGEDGAPGDASGLLAAGPVALAVETAGAEVPVVAGDAASEAVRATTGKQAISLFGATKKKVGGIVVDATAISSSQELAGIYRALHPTAKSVKASGRILVIGLDPDLIKDPSTRLAQRALEGFVRSLAKEIGNGRTVNLVLLAPGGEKALESTVRFFLSARSAYVDAQVVRIGAGTAEAPADWSKPLAGKVALVTGAARGIGASIAQVLARDGAQVIGLDIPPLADELAATLAPLGGDAITLDVTGEDAPAELSAQLKALHGRVDIVVNNAGITQDRTLARMKPERWDAVMAVNLIAPQRIVDQLLKDGLLGKGSRVIGLASIAGIAGNNGQTNYGASKAGMIGLTEAYAELLEEAGGTINAVAPGFIETKMTAAIPLTIREAGRRLNSVSQGGEPVDVAETIAWFASPGSSAINGRVVRVCGQSLLGA